MYLDASCFGIIASREFRRNDGVFPVFSFSLSELKDSLSQWRGYCPNGGYSLSFYREGGYENSQLKKMITENKLYIQKCQYGDDECKEFLTKNIIKQGPNDFIDYMSGRNLGPTEYIPSRGRYETLESILFDLVKHAPLFKDKSFEDEKEWRVVAFNDNHMYDTLVKFREGKNLIIPYLEIPLTHSAEEVVQIGELVVGPTPHMELALNSCRLLRRNTSTIVSPSGIPYRNW